MKRSDSATNSFIVDASQSPEALLRPVAADAVTFTDQFWAPRMLVNRTQTIPAQYEQLVSTGRLDNFKRVAGESDKPYVGIYFNDSDVYKWLEAASWSLASTPDPVLDALCDEVIAIIGGAQDGDGYLDTYFSCERKAERWSNLRDMHELYCAGHFIQAAVAHTRATGKTAALEIAERLAGCICDTFGDGPGQKRLVDGHEEIEMALVELFRVTRERRYLRQAQYFVDLRGAGTIGGGEYHQDHVPIRQMSEITGHAVRALYDACGVADVALETGDSELTDALVRLWQNMTERRMYVSGGLGARWEGEAFGGDYELPNERAYAETCAAIGSLMWNWRMLLMTGETKYADLIEHTLYNAVLPGVSHDGQTFFYQNPLADDGGHRRQPWFGCACCPPNVARLLASLPGYAYSTSSDGLWVHSYAEGSATAHLASGTLSLTQHAHYPWSGEIEIEITAAPESETALRLRIPEWAEGATVAIGGEPRDAVGGGYFEARRVFDAGDTIRVSLPMTPRWLESHPKVLENRGRAALMVGPVLYCFEHVDNPGVDLVTSAVDCTQAPSMQFEPQTLGGVAVAAVHGFSRVVPSDWSGRLTREAPCPEPPPDNSPTALRAVPYFAWANRDPGRMQVWMEMWR